MKTIDSSQHNLSKSALNAEWLDRFYLHQAKKGFRSSLGKGGIVDRGMNLANLYVFAKVRLYRGEESLIGSGIVKGFSGGGNNADGLRRDENGA